MCTCFGAHFSLSDTYIWVEIAFYPAQRKSTRMCLDMLHPLYAASTLQPVFSSDDYVLSCKVCPILQQHLSFRKHCFYHWAFTTFTALFMSHQNGTEASEASLCSRDNVFHMSGRPCVFTLARPDSPQDRCFRSSPIPISFSTFQVGRTFRSL